MAEIKEFVINDRRKFTAEGELRPDAKPAEPSHAVPNQQAESVAPPQGAASSPAPAPDSTPTPAPQATAQGLSLESLDDSEFPSQAGSAEDQLPPPPTPEQAEQANRAYAATVDRLDTAIRATNPGMERLPEMTFDRVVQSLYMQALLQLGGGGEPGQQPQVDLLGARQTIDMLAVLDSKTRGNLSGPEQNLIDSALFEARMAFLEITQAIARQAQSRQPGGPGAGFPPAGPSIVR